MGTAVQSESLERAESRSIQSSQSEIALIPYANLKGVWTLPDEIILGFAKKSKEERTFHTVFYDGTIRSEGDFLEAMKRPANVPVFAFIGNEPVGFAWLNGISGSFAFAHFCMLKKAWGETAESIGKLFLSYWMSFRHSSGESLFDLVIGVIPSNNPKAIGFVQRIGFEPLGTIPELLSNVYAGEKFGANILYYSRANHGRRR